MSAVNFQVFFDISIGDERAGRVVFKLFADEMPLTSENFRALCTGEKGIGKKGYKLHFMCTYIHQVVAGSYICGGDIINRNGTGGESIYGEQFMAENRNLNFSKGGLLAMRVSENGMQSSQFIVTAEEIPQFNGMHHVFGRVISGMDVIRKVSHVKTSAEQRPETYIIITDCGQVSQQSVGKMVCMESVAKDWRSLPLIALAGLPANSTCAEVLNFVREGTNKVTRVSHIRLAEIRLGKERVAFASLFSEKDVRAAIQTLPKVPFGRSYVYVAVIYIGDSGPSSKLHVISDGPKPRHSEASLNMALKRKYPKAKEIKLLQSYPASFEISFRDENEACLMLLSHLNDSQQLRLVQHMDAMFTEEGLVYSHFHGRAVRISFGPYQPEAVETSEQKQKPDTFNVDREDAQSKKADSANRWKQSGMEMAIEASKLRFLLLIGIDNSAIEEAVLDICDNIGDYRVVSKIKNGKMGIVFESAREAKIASLCLEDIGSDPLMKDFTVQLKPFNFDE